MKTVVTAASGRIIDELDGKPPRRGCASWSRSSATRSTSRSRQHTFARYVDGVPYVRSMSAIDGDEHPPRERGRVGHVLRLMQPGDLIGTTKHDLAAAAERVGGIEALLAFSCIGRHWEAQSRNLEHELAESYAAYPTVGFQSFGERIRHAARQSHADRSRDRSAR